MQRACTRNEEKMRRVKREIGGTLEEHGGHSAVWFMYVRLVLLEMGYVWFC